MTDKKDLPSDGKNGGSEDPEKMKSKLSGKRKKQKAEEAPEPFIYCGFCLKQASEVRLMIGGAFVYICDECVISAHKHLKDQGLID